MIAVLDPASHRVNVANAGHVPAIRCRPGKRSKEVGIEQVGTPLGVIEGQQLDASNKIVIEQLSFGGNIESDTAVSLPLDLAVMIFL